MALNLFNHLFCFRCRVFYFRLHRFSQELVFSVEKQLQLGSQETEKDQCDEQCIWLASIAGYLGKGSCLPMFSMSFVADWECDPHSFQNCCISCNDGTAVLIS